MIANALRSSICLRRITYAEDTKIADAGTFTLLKEDHTLGNIIRMSLLADGRVLFAGYRMPHPLENRMIIKIKVRPGFQSVAKHAISTAPRSKENKDKMAFSFWPRVPIR